MYAISIRECQLELLNISKIFHKICVTHDIPYYMIGGTMLGAIRHHGFIPWDDDIDFAVERKYYEHLHQILESELAYPYRLLSWKNVSYPFSYIKIENVRSITREKSRTLPCSKGDNKELQVGINADIFPLDGCSSDKIKVLPIIKKNRFLNRIRTALYFNFENLSLPKRLTCNLIKLIMCYNNKEYWRKLLMEKFFHLVDELHNTGNDALINFPSQYREKEVISRTIWGNPTLYKFEDTEFFGVENYDAYLRILFDDYMTPPPENKRVAHAIEHFYLEDGDE